MRNSFLILLLTGCIPHCPYHICWYRSQIPDIDLQRRTLRQIRCSQHALRHLGNSETLPINIHHFPSPIPVLFHNCEKISLRSGLIQRIEHRKRDFPVLYRHHCHQERFRFIDAVRPANSGIDISHHIRSRFVRITDRIDPCRPLRMAADQKRFPHPAGPGKVMRNQVCSHLLSDLYNSVRLNFGCVPCGSRFIYNTSVCPE